MKSGNPIHFLFLILILQFGNLAPVLAQYPSDSATLYLMTATPGLETYEAFGHSAIRLQDQNKQIDIVYNYGTFDFSTPNFYEKFVFGR